MSLVLGGLMLILGFILYQIGFSIMQQQSLLMADIGKFLLPWFDKKELIGLILEFGGGLVAILGLIITVAGGISSAVGGVALSQSIDTSGRPAMTCKFCGAEMPAGEVFCSSCHKSQA